MSVATATLDDVRQAVADVPDPELPFVTLGDLGIVRDVQWHGDAVLVTVTPTYSGCPATEVIARHVVEAVAGLGLAAEVRTVLAPAWTTDWITERGLEALRDNGIAPPHQGLVAVTLGRHVPSCPRCGSAGTEEVSRFGASACTALWRCRACGEPFDHVRAL
ncbi:MAG: 1,2-phenylacetyl-CoA epoxidase subunit PaaD [Actinomycetota bacterium]